MLKEAKHELAPILARLFQRIIDKGKCPKMWKLSRVRLLKKPGERTAATNHRPIAVGSVLEKVFSRIVVWELVPFLMCNDLISDRQYGFLPGKRLVENIIRFAYPRFSARGKLIGFAIMAKVNPCVDDT